ncbi:MAG: bifunctional UDP-N-acetylglucosamine diphosphorylase/glucosamine-1-phosphate N-acetyltransferase GlmU [Gammaproteobacteria bacterium]|nr:bifunctional UDP-N-acetylglucosamine diphosphorylase/glucosamine-1-phosphate N-acetyltransferase GlmU [Gammaproteobacteria bacterium]
MASPAMTLEAVILAAGEGTRMRSALPKSLHQIGGAPMLAHILKAAGALNPAKIHLVVARRGGDLVKDAVERGLAARRAEELLGKICWATQESSLGTGHAVMQAMPAVGRESTLLVLYGDTPLLRASTLARLAAVKDGVALLTAELENPDGFGRIVRGAGGEIERIIEHKDADAAQKKIRECNAGCMAAPAKVIAEALGGIRPDNAQRELYLTDVVAAAAAAGARITACHPDAIEETIGVNTQADLACAERVFQLEQAREVMARGLCLRDPARFDLRGRFEFGRDCALDINVILEGEISLGARCRIGANSVIRNSSIGDDSVIEANCVLDGAVVGANCVIGPFARLRPRAQLADGARAGNFVEIKNSRVGRGAKANHLSYIGDSEIGAGANIGAGVITCNYDGANKHRSVIGEDVFVGSNSALVAPLRIGDGATIGAGSTITQDVAAADLAVGRARQRAVRGWKRPVKKAGQ